MTSSTASRTSECNDQYPESSYTISSHVDSTSTYICTSYSSIRLPNENLSNAGKLNRSMKILLLMVTLIAILMAIVGSFYSVIDLFDPKAFTFPCFICNTDRLT